MAKDAKGHGSEKRGAAMDRLAAARNDPNHPLGVLSRVVSQGTPIAGQDAKAAGDLAGGHPKSGASPVHPGATGRLDNIDRNLRGPGKHVGYGGGDVYHIQKSNGSKSNWYSGVGQRTGNVVSGKGLREISHKLK